MSLGSALRLVRSPSARALDITTAVLLLAGIVFAPWAFGTTQPWSILTLNINGWCLGALWLWRRRRERQEGTLPTEPWPVVGLRWITLAFLGYEFLALVNAQAVYDPGSLAFSPRWHVPWLPASLDADSTWDRFQRDLALAGTFWGAHAWLSRGRRAFGLPSRHGLVIGVLVLNAVLLGVLGLYARSRKASRLLGITKPTINRSAEQHFGPWPYRSNAVQYFSVVAPAGLALAVAGGRAPLVVRAAVWLGAFFVGILPLMTRSRMGALVGGGALVSAVPLLLAGAWSRSRRLALLAALGALLALGTGLLLGWERISYRIEQGAYFEDTGRATLREAGWRMAADQPWFGTGPGSFATLYQLYRPSNSSIWFAQMHCDWLEGLVTLGAVGMAIVVAGIGLLALASVAPGPGRAPGGCIALLWLGLVSCLLHAVMDFPFQIYSVAHVFVVGCALVGAAGGRQVEG